MNQKITPPSLLKKNRDSNLELYRIVVMLAIVAHHYVLGYGSAVHDHGLNAQTWFLYFYGMWGKTGINCFVLITGYFLCKSSITLKKFLKLLLQIEFYSIAIYLIFATTGYVDFSIVKLIRLLWPVNNVNGSFTAGYLLYFLFIPFLNVLVNNLNKRQHQALLFMSLFVYSVMAKIPESGGVRINLNYLTWFSIIHIIASYIRLYPSKKENNTRYWLFVTVINIVIAMLSVIVVRKTGMGAYYFVSDSNAPLALCTSVSLFVLFKSLDIPYSRTINVVAASTFGVFLIHTRGDAMRQWLWGDTLKNVEMLGSSCLYIHALLSVLFVFSVCAFIDWIRRLTIEKPALDIAEKIINKLFHLITIR